MEEVKYTGHTPELRIWDHFRQKQWIFKRNRWYSLPDDLANSLLAKKERYWVSKKNLNSALPFTPTSRSKYIVIERNYAFGDLIMLVPVLRKFRLERPNDHLTLITTGPMKRIFVDNFLTHDVIDRQDSRVPHIKENCDLFICLDGILEQDHNMDNKESKMHRVSIYEEALRLSDSSERNWSLRNKPEHLQKFKNIFMEKYISDAGL